MMAKVELEIPQNVYDNLLVVVDACNRHAEEETTHGNSLTVEKLLLMVAEDLAMTNSRPGSWEGANMQQVLDSHGYS